MSAMGGVRMPGGWMMSMAWMRMPGQSWAGAFGSFLVMWLAMMMAMMLPSLLPALQRCRARRARPSLSIVVALGYFAVSMVAGAAVFPLGAALAAVQMEWPFLALAAPGAAGLVVVVAGLVQFTRWKAHHLACCREACGHGGAGATGTLSAWRSGLHLLLRPADGSAPRDRHHGSSCHGLGDGGHYCGASAGGRPANCQGRRRRGRRCRVVGGRAGRGCRVSERPLRRAGPRRQQRTYDREVRLAPREPMDQHGQGRVLPVGATILGALQRGGSPRPGRTTRTWTATPIPTYPAPGSSTRMR